MMKLTDPFNYLYISDLALETSLYGSGMNVLPIFFNLRWPLLQICIYFHFLSLLLHILKAIIAILSLTGIIIFRIFPEFRIFEALRLFLK